MLVRSKLVDLKPFRTGLVIGAFGLMLALGRDQGGAIGGGLAGGLANVVGETGVLIVGIALFVAGTLLFTGGSAGAVLRTSGGAMRRAGGAARRSFDGFEMPDFGGSDDLDDDVDGSSSASRSSTRPRAYPDVIEPVATSAESPQLVMHSEEDAPDAVTAGDVVRGDRVRQRRRCRVPPARPVAPQAVTGREGRQRRRRARRRPSSSCRRSRTSASTPRSSARSPARGSCATSSSSRPERRSRRSPGSKDDLSYALATTEIRILAPIPGKQAVGVEVPNLSPKLVTLGDIFGDMPGQASPLSVWLGKDISGNAVWTDLARMPHLLIAGTTGSGKSGCINTLLTSILLRSTPDEVRMILIDPKRIELNYYESIPHLLTPVVSNPKEASAVLQNVVAEMERRYERLSIVRARNLPEANRTFKARGEEPLPYLLVVIDELADLMMVSPQAVEDAIIRLAQKSRAVGIHLVLATQRPSVDVITGMIKANVPSRIAFAVSSQTDSRVILDTSGAESLLGQGDMLFKPLGTSRMQRVQGAYVAEEEVAMVVEQCRRQRGQVLDESLLEAPETFADEMADGDDGEFDPDEDPLLDKATEIVVQTQTASVSLIQRRLRVGYTRAGRLIDMLERRGVISGYEGSKPRRVLIEQSSSHSDRPSRLNTSLTTSALRSFVRLATEAAWLISARVSGGMAVRNHVTVEGTARRAASRSCW